MFKQSIVSKSALHSEYYLYSNDRHPGETASNFNIITPSNLVGFKNLVPVQFSGFYSWYLINHNNNILKLYWTGYANTQRTLELQYGNYTPVELAAHITSLLSTYAHPDHPGVYISCEYIPTSNKFRFNGGVGPYYSITILDTQDGLHPGLKKILGVTLPNVDTRITGNHVAQMVYTQDIYICSRRLTQYKSGQQSSNFVLGNVLMKVPVVDLNPNDGINVSPFIPTKFYWYPNEQLGSIDMQVYDQYGELIEFNGVDWSMKFVLTNDEYVEKFGI